jgi:hypothetical protein
MVHENSIRCLLWLYQPQVLTLVPRPSMAKMLDC